MACPITLGGIDKGCKDNIGGVNEFYAIDRTNVTLSGITQSTGSTISAIPIGVENFKTYKIRKQTANLTTNLVPNDAAENNTFESTLTVKFAKMDSVKRLEFENLIKGDLMIIVKMNSGKYFLLGYDNEVTVSAYVGNTGTTFTEGSMYDLSFMDISYNQPFEVDSSIISSLLS